MNTYLRFCNCIQHENCRWYIWKLFEPFSISIVDVSLFPPHFCCIWIFKKKKWALRLNWIKMRIWHKTWHEINTSIELNSTITQFNWDTELFEEIKTSIYIHIKRPAWHSVATIRTWWWFLPATMANAALQLLKTNLVMESCSWGRGIP